MTKYEQIALERAEDIGIIEYKVVKNIMDYVSYYGNEGYLHVRRNLDTGKESRVLQKSTKRPYNYFCG